MNKKLIILIVALLFVTIASIFVVQAIQEKGVKVKIDKEKASQTKEEKTAQEKQKKEKAALEKQEQEKITSEKVQGKYKTKNINSQGLSFVIPEEWIAENHKTASKYYPKLDKYSKALIYLKTEGKNTLLPSESFEEKIQSNISQTKKTGSVKKIIKDETTSINGIKANKIDYIDQVEYNFTGEKDLVDPNSENGRTYIKTVYFVNDDKLYTLELYSDGNLGDDKVFERTLKSLDFEKKPNTDATNPIEAKEKKLEILEYGSYNLFYDNSKELEFMAFAAKIKNPNKNTLLNTHDKGLKVTAKDKQGKTIFSRTESFFRFDAIYPGETYVEFLFCDDFDLKEDKYIKGDITLEKQKKIKNVELEVVENKDYDKNNTTNYIYVRDGLLLQTKEINYEVIKKGNKRAGSGKALVTGTITNPNPFAHYRAELTYVAKNKKGEIIYGESDVIKNIKRKGETELKVKLEYDSRVSKYEVYLNPIGVGSGEV